MFKSIFIGINLYDITLELGNCCCFIPLILDYQIMSQFYIENMKTKHQRKYSDNILMSSRDTKLRSNYIQAYNVKHNYQYPVDNQYFNREYLNLVKEHHKNSNLGKNQLLNNFYPCRQQKVFSYTQSNGFDQRLSHHHQKTYNKLKPPRNSMGNQPNPPKTSFNKIYNLTDQNIEMRRMLNDQLKKNNQLLRNCNQIQKQNQILIYQEKQLQNTRQLLKRNEQLRKDIQRMCLKLPQNIIKNIQGMFIANKIIKNKYNNHRIYR